MCYRQKEEQKKKKKPKAVGENRKGQKKEVCMASPVPFPQSRGPPGSALTCDVIDYDGHGGVANVAGDQTAETLLSGRVPQLQPHLADQSSPRKNSRGREKERGEQRGGETEERKW